MARFKKSFYTWCIENNKQDLLDRWDYEKNKLSPHEVGFSSNQFWWFKCPTNPTHHSEQILLNSISCGRGSDKCIQCNSFGQWCLDNKHGDLLDRWDYSLNHISPFDVLYMSHSRYYFLCPHKKHASTPKIIYSIVNNTQGKVNCIGCDSFGEWTEETFGQTFFKTYWSDKNTVDPYQVPRRANRTSIIINCLEKDYHGDYTTTPDTFVHGCRCPYCGHTKLHILDSLGSVYPEVLKIWSDKNKKSPFEYMVNSECEVWWKCLDEKHDDYLRKISESNRRNFRCPQCSVLSNSSLLQKSVDNYILENYSYTVLHEHECTIRPINPKTKMPMPFDNEIVELHLIIEVHGAQHYNDYFYKTFLKMSEEDANAMLLRRQEYDRYKKEYALSHGYEYLEIPYWTESDETYKQLIDEKIKSIVKC